MSGHSKWANIKRHKAVIDAKKGAVYARMSREIIVAAKLGGADPNLNFRLRQAVDRARAGGVPNDNIQRAIEKGTGGADSQAIEELTYEGYGPAGVAIMVACATDNRNRTAGDLRSYFSKYGGNLGESGCVGWMFKERGEVAVEPDSVRSEDELLLAAVDAGADDLDHTDEETFLVICQPPTLEAVKTHLERSGYRVSDAKVSMAPISTTEVLNKDAARQLLKLLDALESHDDVQQVYTNFDMNSDWISDFTA